MGHEVELVELLSEINESGALSEKDISDTRNSLNMKGSAGGSKVSHASEILGGLHQRHSEEGVGWRNVDISGIKENGNICICIYIC